MELPLLLLCFQSVLDVESSAVEHTVLIQVELVGMQFVQTVIFRGAAADEGIHTGCPFQEIGEILTAGSTGEADQMLFANGVFHSPLRDTAAAFIRDGRRQIDVIIELIGSTMSFTGSLDDSLDLLRQSLAQLGIEEKDYDAVMREWENGMRAMNDTITVYEGAQEMLEALQAEGVGLGIATSKTRDQFDKDFCRFEIAKYFDFSITCEETDDPKPGAGPLKAYMKATSLKVKLRL